MRINFWPGLRFVDLADLNRQGRDWLDFTANVRIHGTTGEVPFTRLPQERLQPLLGKAVYDTSLVSFRRATKDCFVSYGGNYYSVPSEYARKTLKLKEYETGQLLVLNAQENSSRNIVLCPASTSASHCRRITPTSAGSGRSNAGLPCRSSRLTA